MGHFVERMLASNDPTRGLRLVFEALGLIRAGSSSNVSVGVNVSESADRQPEPERDIEEILAQRLELQRIIHKYVAPKYPQYFPECFPNGATPAPEPEVGEQPKEP